MKEGKEYMKPPEPHMCVMTMTTVSSSLIKRLKIISYHTDCKQDNHALIMFMYIWWDWDILTNIPSEEWIQATCMVRGE